MWIRTIGIPNGFWHYAINEDETACHFLEAKGEDIEVQARVEKPENDICGFCENALRGVHPVFGNANAFDENDHRRRARTKELSVSGAISRNFG